MAREASQLLYDAIINHFKRFNFDRKYTTAHFDETYIFKDPSQIPGDSYYNECLDHPLSEDQKVRPKAKFSPKHMVWHCIAENGMVSEPFFTPNSMNQKVYRDECVSRIKRLIAQLNVD